MFRNTLVKIIVALAATSALSANAALYTYTGEIVNSNPVFVTLGIVPGLAIGGDFEIADAAVAAGNAGIADIGDIGMSVGGFCFTYLAGSCAAGSVVPITAIDVANISFDSLGNVTGGNLDLTTFSPSFQIFIPVSFDLTNGTFLVTSPLGNADGTGSLAAAPVPVPAAAWLLGSALLGLMGLRRRA